MIGGKLGPHGLIAPPSSALFINIIVKAPIVQIFNIVLGMITLALEWPIPGFADSSVQRSHIAKSAFYFLCSFFAILVYQSVDSSLYYLTALALYLRAESLGEITPLASTRKSSVGPV